MNIEDADSCLIDQFLAGKQAAFGELVNKYQGYVRNIVYSLIGDTSNADDMAQEVFIKAYSSLNSFRKQAKFSTWLYRITVNTAYNYLKSRKRYVPLDSVPETPTTGNSPAQDLEDKEKQKIIAAAIEKLPFKYRTVVILKDVEGLSYEDIAMTLRCRIGTVESRLFRARIMLKNMLLPLFTKER